MFVYLFLLPCEIMTFMYPISLNNVLFYRYQVLWPSYFTGPYKVKWLVWDGDLISSGIYPCPPESSLCAKRQRGIFNLFVGCTNLLISNTVNFYHSWPIKFCVKMSSCRVHVLWIIIVADDWRVTHKTSQNIEC